MTPLKVKNSKITDFNAGEDVGGKRNSYSLLVGM
jgi:hypothetical protein